MIVKLKDYKIKYEEEGAIPLFYPINKIEQNKINIGSAGCMTRTSTGYTFLNIQEHSKYITKNIEMIEKAKIYHIGKKYEFLDKIFLNVLKRHPDKMPKIFFDNLKFIFSQSWKGGSRTVKSKSSKESTIS